MLAPVVQSLLAINRTDSELVRFWQLWKLYDQVTTFGVQFRLPLLGVETSPFLGGYSEESQGNPYLSLSDLGVLTNLEPERVL